MPNPSPGFFNSIENLFLFHSILCWKEFKRVLNNVQEDKSNLNTDDFDI